MFDYIFYKKCIIYCIVTIVIAFFIKLFNVDIFYIKSENENFINFCNFLDNTLWLKTIIYAIIYSATTSIFLLIVLEQPKFIGKENLVFIVIPIVSCLKTLCVFNQYFLCAF